MHEWIYLGVLFYFIFGGGVILFWGWYSGFLLPHVGVFRVQIIRISNVLLLVGLNWGNLVKDSLICSFYISKIR